MIRSISKEEHYKNAKRLIQFCKDNHCLMYKVMNSIENDRYQNQGQCCDCQKKDWKKLEERGVISKKVKKDV